MVGGWMDECVDGWVDGWMVGGWVDGWVNGTWRVDGRVDNGWMVRQHVVYQHGGILRGREKECSSDPGYSVDGP